MKQIIHNGYIKLETIEHKTFLQGESQIYEEIGTVIAKDKSISGLAIGDRVFFDSWMVKKYPILGEEGKFHWLIPYDQIVMSERNDTKTISKVGM